MFNSILTIGNALGTQPDPDSIEDTDPPFTAPLPDTGELLAAVGVLDLPRFGGELVAHARPAISNWTGLW